MRTSISIVLLLFALLPSQARAQLGVFDVAAIYAASAPGINSFIPLQGSPGGTITIIGQNFTNVVRVVVGLDVPSYTIDSRSKISARIPTIPIFSGPTDVSVWVVTHSGLGFAQRPFKYVPTRTTPNVIGLILSAAEQKIMQASLTVGSITGPTSPSSVVTNQRPAGGTVSTNTSVDLSTVTPTSGFSGITVLNNLSRGDSVVVWLWDGTIGQWAVQDGGSLLASQSTSPTITLTTNHSYKVALVDPSDPLCPSPRPDDSRCVPWETTIPIPGDQNGPTLALQAQ
jgi:hypothetical protein